MKALMKRFGGHPYERGDVLDFKAVDPDRPIHENLLALGYHNNELVSFRVGDGGRDETARWLKADCRHEQAADSRRLEDAFCACEFAVA